MAAIKIIIIIFFYPWVYSSQGLKAIIIIITIITNNTQVVTYRVWGSKQVTETAPLQVVSWVEGMKTCRECRMTLVKDLFSQRVTTQTACTPGTSCRGARVPAALWQYLSQ